MMDGWMDGWMVGWMATSCEDGSKIYLFKIGSFNTKKKKTF
jgi:hypothetical protein